MVSGWTDQKKHYRKFKEPTQQLPENYRKAVDALERYMEFFGPGTADTLLPMLEDLADLFEQAVANGTSVRGIVGDDPVEFAEAFLRNYPTGKWISKEQERLIKTIDSVAGNTP